MEEFEENTIDFGFPMAGQWNTTQHITLENLKMDAHMIWLLCSLSSAICWVTYITFYNSRLMGLLLTKLVNRWLIRGACFKLGSLTLNPLAGKVMFRDFVYICFDYSIRIQDGYVIFRWWRSYVPKDVSEDLSHSDTRLSIQLNGFEVHIYNRSDLYDKVEKTFGLKRSVLIPTENMSSEEIAAMKENAMNLENNYQQEILTKKEKNVRPEAMTATTWRDLIPVIKIDICSGRFVFGNRLTPTTLSISVEEAHCTYSTKPAVSKLDHFMHFVKAKVENAKVMFAPSPKYTGLIDEPPRYMGEGFVVMMSNFLELYFYMDEPGLVPEEPVHLTLANGDIVEPSPPMWGIDIKCGKGTDFSYGPWADRQRDYLFKFFFPTDFQELIVTEHPKAGERRRYQSFDVTLCTLNEATVDILFSKEKETNAMHVTIGPGSYVEITLPWVTQSDGFVTKVAGQLLHVEATTSLQYRSLAECESLEYKVRVHYPRIWNDNQDWIVNLTGCKATAYIVYKHKSFFQDLIEDWTSKSRPDILSFMPYKCKFNILLKEFELITLSNEYNWIDCSSANQENHHLAFCGDLFDLSFCLPFDDFLPQTVTLKFWIHGEGLDLSMYLPEISTSKPVVLAIDENAKILTRTGKIEKRPNMYTRKWRRICQRSSGWIDCWTVPIVALSIQYIYHPIPPLGPKPQADITTPEKEEILLSPMRIPKSKKSPAVNWRNVDSKKFDPSILEADQVTVELEIGSSVLMVYGSVLRNFIHLKENIFGEDQNFTDMEQFTSTLSPNLQSLQKDQVISKDAPTKSISEISAPEDKEKPFDSRLFRPLEVIVSVIIHDIQGHLMKNCNENDTACPVVLVERLGFEMKKSFTQTELQVLVSPSYMIISDKVLRPGRDQHLKQGHLLLSALQVRGHAMFSNEGCKLGEDTLEYGWLLEIQLGKFSGKITMPQLSDIVIGLETFVYLTIDPENCLKSPTTVRNCHHGVPTIQCPQTKEDIRYRCPSSEDIKYRMTRLSIDAIDVYIVESGIALHTWASPIRLTTCNLHGKRVKSGVSGLLPSILIRQFMINHGVYTNLSTGNSVSNTNTTGSNRSYKNQQKQERRDDTSIKFNEHSTKTKHNSQRRDSKDRDDPNQQSKRFKKGFSGDGKKYSDESGGGTFRERTPRENDYSENWLEVAYMSLGPILIEGCSALPIPDHNLHVVQHNFLKEHDEKTKRLWFLWTSSGNKGEISRCGCIGGCLFFGGNRNGMKFFKPSAQDAQDNSNIARYQVLNNPKEYGFGESIVHAGQLVFHTPPYSLQSVSLHDTADILGKVRGPKYPYEVKNVNATKSEQIKISEKCSKIPEKYEMNKNRKENSSPSTYENRNKRYPYTAQRQASIEVPYSRLLDSPSKKLIKEDIDDKTLSGSSYRRRSDSRSSNILKVSTPKTSISDSRLTAEYITDEDVDVPADIPHSVPKTYALNCEIDDMITSQIDIGRGTATATTTPEVQRTISLTSENPSEMFFSAEEDIPNVILHSGGSYKGPASFSQKKRFSSDLSIGTQNEIGASRILSTHRSDHEIHLPEGSKILPKRPQSTVELVDVRDSSSNSNSPSLSSTSFISAVSSQEDMALINLHMQLNRPIIESPLLMASYLNQLAQIKCNNWYSCSFPFGADAFSTPLFQENDDGGLTYIGNKMVPHFDTYSNWREIRVLPRCGGDCLPNASSGGSSSGSNNIGSACPNSHPWDPSVFIKESEKQKTESAFDDDEFLCFRSETGICTSIVVKFKGQINILMTPLMLEGCQRMLESLMTKISSMHLMSVVNFVHLYCIAKVRNNNILKQDQSLSYWSQVHSNSKRSTTERNLQGPGDSILSDVYEESISTKSQGLVILPRISIALLQSSIVEEVISITALDNIHSLSCVSLLALYLENVSTKFHLGKTMKAAVRNVYIQQTIRSGANSKKGGIMKGTKAFLAHLSSQTRPDNIQGEPVLIETSEKQLEELVITLDVGKAHTQLRRLKTDGNGSQDPQIIVTAIPEHKSQAMFECLKIPEVTGSDGIGYIMFECGLEGVSMKVVKRSQFEKSENSNEDVEINETNENYVNEAAPVIPPAAKTTETTSETKSESAWRLITKKPPTPKTPIETKVKNLFRKKEKTSETSNNVKETDKISSCVVKLEAVWFNFAAPPCVPITRKIDLTRLDWNLLSTASPAITAWMNPCNRLAIKIVSIMRALRFRYTTVAACLMADALENEKVEKYTKMKKSRYNSNFTLLSKTLQEDPSCQLCTIMQKLALEEGADKFENIFKQYNTPHLNILRQGVIVLSRQWKNILYNPILFEHQYKNRLSKPVNVTFSFPQVDEDNDDTEYETGPTISNLNPGENPEENESALLLGQIDQNNGVPTFFGDYVIRDPLGKEHSFPPSPYMNKAKPKPINELRANSSRSSIQVLPIISGLVEKQNPEIEYGTLQEGSLSSTNSIDRDDSAPGNQKEDLYFWMAKQQKIKQKKDNEKDQKSIFGQTFLKPTNNPMAPNKGIFQDSIKLLDAHLIFEPILTCLGVMPQQMMNKLSNSDISSLENFGTNLSLIGTFDSIRIDIVVSEAGDKKKPKCNKRSNGKPLQIIDTPSFLCERVGIELEVLKMSDGLIDQTKQNFIYVSRSQLKKHTSTVVNFSLIISFISQQVNMPLLRLLHQITNMYQNVREAQNEFQGQPELNKKYSGAKDESSIASEMNEIYPCASSVDRQMNSDNFSDERYDKFSDIIPFVHSATTKSGTSQTNQPLHLTPSPNAKNRPQSFAQKLMSTSKSVKGKLGYTNLNESNSSPFKESPCVSIYEPNNIFKSGDSRNSFNGYGMIMEEGNNILRKKVSDSFISPGIPILETPNCWKTIFYLLELYGTLPETKTINRASTSNDANDPTKSGRKVPFSSVRLRNKENEEATNKDFVRQESSKNLETVSQERTRLIIFGVAKIHKIRLLATLSGLKLEAEITTLNSSTTWRKKTRPVSLECSLTGQVGRAMIVLLEGVAPNQQTVVKVTVGKSQTLYSSVTKKGKDKNNGLLSIGPVNIDIPQHPVALHGMMTRSSKQLSSTLQELRVGRNSMRNQRHGEETDSPFPVKDTKEKSQQKKPINTNIKPNYKQNNLLQPLVMQFNILLQSLSINAALLPSLQAQYTMNSVSSTGVTGSKAKFVIDLPTHSLSFTTKIQTTEANLPSEASIALPLVHVSAEYIPESGKEDLEIDGIVLHEGSYVKAYAEIGEFERCLTTDLLNHLVFVQKVFMKEVNEVVQKVYGGEKPVPLWLEDNESNNIQSSSLKRLLFSLNICVKRIQLTATTPCSSAVRFETGTLELHLSNRVKNVGEGSDRKLFGKAQIDFHLSLGQIIKNVIFDEAEPEFQQYAFFHTTINLRNAFQDELLNEDKELILLTLKRPLVSIQPVAVDKAILVWLNYKNAYQYWTEKRANLNIEMQPSAQQVFGQFGNIAAPNLSTLFLQLTVEDMGICLPLNPITTTWGARSFQDFEPKGAVVITLENTIISACNSGSLVSKGKFSELCLRFADDFETTLDDWKPNTNDTTCIMNLCVVSEGTYEVCSRTIAAKGTENAKWFLNVKWQMEGVDIHLDTNIGKQLSSLGHTLTMLTSFEEEDPNGIESPYSDDGEQSARDSQPRKKYFEHLPSFVFDPTIDSKNRVAMMEKEISEQFKIINDLRTLGASHNTIAHEERRLQELQAISYKYFKREMIQKWKRPSMRRAMMKTTNRSQSFVATQKTIEESCSGKLDTIASNDEDTSVQSTPKPGPSRSASLKVCIPTTHRVTFSETMRQTSLPNTETDGDLVEDDLEWTPYDDSISSEIEIAGTQVELRKKPPPIQKPQDPNVDFELDIKVLVNSGKCVLHTKETDEKFAALGPTVKYHKRERSLGTEWGSPTPSRKHKDKNKLRYNTSANTVLMDLTIFRIPGLDVKLNYQSKTIFEDNQPRTVTLDPYISGTRRLGSKRASLFAGMTLQSIPEETIISPHILEFLEQTLDPIPSNTKSDIQSSPNVTSNPVNIDILPSTYVTYASFPVDVIVYFHMQPSTFRFSCLPVSRVECMLQLPSLDIVFSSKRSEEDLSGLNEPDKPLSGGLSVTGYLADFNVYIFHPYGGKKSGVKEAQFSPLTDSERKDSLSINVEFVKFHLTRSRKVFTEAPSLKRGGDQSKAVIRFSTIIDIGSASFKYDMRRLTEILAFPKAWYRRRIVRRLFLGDLSVHQQNTQTDSLNDFAEKQQSDAFKPPSNMKQREEQQQQSSSVPKHNALCLKFEKDYSKYDKLKEIGKLSVDSSVSPSEQSQISAWETLVLFAFNFTKLNVQMNMGNVMGNVVWLTRDFQSDGRLSIRSTGHKNMHIGVYLGGSSLDAKGGIVGGNFELNSIDTQFRIKEEINLEPQHNIGLEFVALELRLDYMGTSVLMTRISSFSARLQDDWKTNNELATKMKNALIFVHGDLTWDQLQIMISKSTTADLLKMFYKLEEFFTQQFKSSKRVFSSLDTRFNSVSGSLRKKQLLKKKQFNENTTVPPNNTNSDARHHRHWQKPLLQALSLSRISPYLFSANENTLGGTMELHGNNISLACFHGINFKSKSWALFSLKEPCINFVTQARQDSDLSVVHVIETLTFSLGQKTQAPQNHSMAIVSRITRNIVFPPQFKSLNEWFLYAFANSEIDAVDRFPILERDKEIQTNSMERARTSSSSSKGHHDHNHNREVIFALPSLQLHFKTEHKQGPTTPELSEEKPIVTCSFITEFEDHIFVTVDADAFFFLHDLITSYVKEKEKVVTISKVGAQNTKSSYSAGGGTGSNSSNSSQFNYSTSRLSMSNKPMGGSGDDDKKSPQVTKDHGTEADSNQTSKGNGTVDENNLKLELFLRDWRHFECKTWHLEPTVRLLSWAGKSIEPYGIDYILNKLGFSHARTTIPKWLQRGFMDPLDKVQALLLMQLLTIIKEERIDSYSTK